MKKVALIVAGGSGSRMGTDIPKQFLLLKGYPVLMHTIRHFHLFDGEMELIVVLPENLARTWQELCTLHDFRLPHKIRPGGETRFHSVRRNLDEIADETLIAVHDGVRPLVSQETLVRCFKAAMEYGNAVPCISIPETLRVVEGDNSRQVDRMNFRLIQTPQVFLSHVLKRAYQQEFRPDFTDDAGVVENMGHTIHLVEGNPENIKITVKKDLILAEALLAGLFP